MQAGGSAEPGFSSPVEFTIAVVFEVGDRFQAIENIQPEPQLLP